MKKRINRIIVLCMLFNNCAFAGDIDISSQVLAPAIQASVFELSSFTMQPFAVMTGLIQGVPFLPVIKTDTKNQRKENNSEENRSYLYSNSTNKTNFFQQYNNLLKSAVIAAQSVLPQIGITSGNSPPIWTGLFYVFLLSYLVILARSNLPWQIKHHRFVLAQLCFSLTGFFNCREIYES